MAAETLGGRMRSAAKARRLSAYKIAQALGVYPQTVYDWWNDEYRPEPHRLRAYAAVLEVGVSELGGREMQEEVERMAVDILVDAFAQIAAGEEPPAAFRKAASTAREWTPEEEGALTAGAPVVRDYLNQLAGGHWNRLTLGEQIALVQRLMTASPEVEPPPAPPESTTG